MGRYLAVGANLFARNPRFDDGANEFAPTRTPRDIPVEPSGLNRETTALVARIVGANSFAPSAARIVGANSFAPLAARIVGANSFAPLAARIQPNLEESRM
jgi:hypothetical protein